MWSCRLLERFWSFSGRASVSIVISWGLFASSLVASGSAEAGSSEIGFRKHVIDAGFQSEGATIADMAAPNGRSFTEYRRPAGEGCGGLLLTHDGSEFAAGRGFVRFSGC